MSMIAEWMLNAIEARDNTEVLAAIHAEVTRFARQFPLPSDRA
jgi:glycine/serine hydroxymethyltransferase